MCIYIHIYVVIRTYICICTHTLYVSFRSSCVYLSVCLSVYLATGLFVCLLVSLFGYLFVLC